MTGKRRTPSTKRRSRKGLKHASAPPAQDEKAEQKKQQPDIDLLGERGPEMHDDSRDKDEPKMRPHGGANGDPDETREGEKHARDVSDDDHVEEDDDKDERGHGTDEAEAAGEDATEGVEDESRRESKKGRQRTASSKDDVNDLYRAPVESAASQKTRKVERGVIYFSSIPPFMKPMKLKHIMSQYGEVDRMFLQPEDPEVRKRRIKQGGSKKLNYVEGWVEFLNKKTAKKVALALNGTLVGGKRNSYHHDFLWNMKYLPKFKWHHLQERMEYERASRRHRLKAELARMQQQTTAYIRQVQAAKRLQRAVAKGVARHDAKRKQQDAPRSFNPELKQRDPIQKRAKKAEGLS